ncbi:hypothetical protein JCM5296_005335 [Sporobolomyces johnsonii]
MSDIVSQRRGSAASSVSVTISTETTTTSASSLPETSIQLVKFATVVPFAGQTPSAPPAVVPTTNSPPHAQYIVVDMALPPPYSFPPTSSAAISPAPTTSIHPLSFYPFLTLTPLSSLSHPSIDPSRTTPPPPPPAYRDVPRTLAERCFWWGFLCPLVWLVGVSKLWSSERPAGFAGEKDRHDIEAAQTTEGQGLDLADEFLVSGAGRGGTGIWSGHPVVFQARAPTVEESIRLWREEEQLWARRCAWSVGAVIAIGGLVGVVLASLMGKI